MAEATDRPVTASRARSRRGGAWPHLAWALVGLGALLGAWNQLATGYSPAERGLTRRGNVFYQASRNLGRTLADLPPPKAPRIAIFGSSQIATVKDGGKAPGQAIPFQVSDALTGRGVPNEVVDFSDGGQQLVESMVVLLAAGDVAKPRVVLIGVSVFSMLRTDVRPTLLESLDVAALRAEVLRNLPPGLERERVDELLAFSEQAPQRVEARGKTIQQRTDHRIATWLEAHVASIANRQVMFDELIDTPLRRDLVAFMKQRFDAARTARSYRIGPAYAPSLAALEVMARWCTRRDVSLVVVLMPFDHRRPPVPFAPETQERLTSDLATRASRDRFRVIDLSRSLDSRDFRDFVDGSPDNLHFDARGHQRIGWVLGGELSTLLVGGPAAHRERGS